MKKIIIILLAFLTFTSYGQADFEKIAIHENVETASTSKIVSQQPGTGELNYLNATALPISTPTQNALDMKLNISDLPTNLTLYPTTAASDVGGYVKMVTDIHDADYNTVAVDVSTPTITGTAQLVSQRISAPGVLIGQPGVFNITTFGNIKRLSGTGTANFYFEVYHRDLAGTETLICTSSVSDVVSLSTYSEFTASGVWDDGDFIATDRIVIKTYANRIAGGTDPVYQFQFGGTQPVRTLLPVPFSVVDAGYEMSSNKQNSLAIDGTGTKYPTVDAVNSEVVKLSGDQNIFGNKTFDNAIITNSLVRLDNSGTVLAYKRTSFNTNIDVVEPTATRNILFPNDNGTVALTKLTVRKISTNTTLADSDNGTIILLTASCTVTLPNGLMSGFNCSFSTQTGVTMTYALGGSVTLINNAGTTMAQNLSHTIVNTGISNEYLTAGSL